MPIDQKRINGPEGSLPYQLFVESRNKTFEERLENVFDRAGSRKCGRKDNESRKYCKLFLFYTELFIRFEQNVSISI